MGARRYGISQLNTRREIPYLQATMYYCLFISTLYCFICPYSLVDNLKSPYLLAPD